MTAVEYNPSQKVINKHWRAFRKWQSLKLKCRSKKLPFNLTISDIVKLQKKKFCPITGVKMRLSVDTKQYPDTLTFDRIIPKLGYTQGNVVACTQHINGLKSDMSFQDIEKLYLFLKPHEPKAL